MRSIVRRLLIGFVVVGALIGGIVATSAAVPMPKAHVVGTWANQGNVGGWILWSNGKVQQLQEAPFYGDARGRGLNNFVGMIPWYEGYFLITSTGHIFSYGQPCDFNGTLQAPRNAPRSGVIGAINRSDGYAGITLLTASGATYQYECVNS